MKYLKEVLNVGDRVKMRGGSREGVIQWIRGYWLGVKWDNDGATQIRRMDEIEKGEP